METIDPTIVLSALLGIPYLVAVGVVLKKREFRERVVVLLILYLALSFVLVLGQVLLELSRSGLLGLASPGEDVLARVLLYAVFFLSLLFLHLSRAFVRIESVGWGWWALGAAWAAAAVALNELDGRLLPLPEVLWAGDGWALERGELGLGALVLGWVICMGGATLLTTRAHHRAQQPLHRNRVTCWSLTLMFTLASTGLFFIGRDLVGSGFHLLGALSAAYLVTSHRLPDLRQVVRHVGSYLIITLLAVVIYTGGFLAIQYTFPSLPGHTPLSAGAALALILALLFNPLLRLVQRLVDRLVFGTSYDPSSTLREYSMSISNILDLDRLAMVAVSLIGEAMGTQRGALFVVHFEKEADGGPGGEGGKGHFRLRALRGLGDGLSSGALSFESPVANYLRLKRQPLTQYDVDLLPDFQETSSAELDWLGELDMDVYVPIYAKGEWIGLLALGPKVSGDCYFEEDLVLLSTLADQTAVALENARLFDDLKARNAENERLNEDLTTANRELAQLDQAKTDFIDIASHELRTPLTQIYGYNDLLGSAVAEGALDPEMGLRLTRGVGKAARRLKEIVDLMLDVSQLDTETMALDVSRTSVAVTVQAAASFWRAALDEREQTLTIRGLDDLPPIMADGGRLRQVFSHLIQNAIKYTPDGGLIRVTGHHLREDRSSEGQTVTVVVSDTGIGIASDDLERIFEKFYRAGDVMSHSTGETKFKGAGPGLGLTIARGIVEAHGGRIWAESAGCDERICPGSEFHVVLPVQPDGLEPVDSERMVAAMQAKVR